MGPSDTQIVALKMDVDRFECDIFAEFAKLRRVQDGTVVDGSLHAAYEGDAHLAPLQIAFELLIQTKEWLSLIVHSGGRERASRHVKGGRDEARCRRSGPEQDAGADLD